jgi:hypothetical protein
MADCTAGVAVNLSAAYCSNVFPKAFHPILSKNGFVHFPCPAKFTQYPGLVRSPAN